MSFVFSRKEFRILLDMAILVDIAVFLGSDFRDDDYSSDDIGAGDELNGKLHSMFWLCQKIYSHASDMEFDNLIDYDEESSSYIPMPECMESLPEDVVFSGLRETAFWDLLPWRLAERDAREQLDMAIKKDAELEDAMIRQLFTELLEQYWDEIEDHGIDRLRIQKHTIH